jgi:YVTN family beta-propeller protein
MLLVNVLLVGALVLGNAGIAAMAQESETPSPALLVTIRGAGEHSLAIVDPATNKVVGRVLLPGGGYPHEIAVSDNGRIAYVTQMGYGKASVHTNPDGIKADFINVIDLSTQKVVNRIQTGLDSWPHGIVFAGGKVYFTAEGYQLVGRYDPTTDKIDWMAGTGQHRQHMIVVSPDLNHIFTANTASNTAAAIDHVPDVWKASGQTHETWNLTVIPVGPQPEGIAMSPDGKEVWVLTSADRGKKDKSTSGGGVSIIDVATKKVMQTLDLKSRTPVRMKFTPDGKLAVISDLETGDVMILDAATRKEIKRINVGTRTHGVLITPDGSRAYVTVTEDNNIAVIDLKTLSLTGRIYAGTQAEGLGWAQAK